MTRTNNKKNTAFSISNQIQLIKELTTILKERKKNKIKQHGRVTLMYPYVTFRAYKEKRRKKREREKEARKRNQTSSQKTENQRKTQYKTNKKDSILNRTLATQHETHWKLL